MLIATDREALHADTLLYEAAERSIENWARERRRQAEQRRQFFTDLQRIRSSSKSSTASAAVFHGKLVLTRRQRDALRQRQQQEFEQRKKERDAERRARRGTGPVRKCQACQTTIYRGYADTCGCRPCAHCGHRFRGAGFKCESCHSDPALITARGTETRSFVPHREAQAKISALSVNAQLMEVLLEDMPRWMVSAIERRYVLKQSDRNAAEESMIPVSVFCGRVRAAVARVAELLANCERSAV